jgi:hypothetical protein
VSCVQRDVTAYYVACVSCVQRDVTAY